MAQKRRGKNGKTKRKGTSKKAPGYWSVQAAMQRNRSRARSAGSRVKDRTKESVRRRVRKARGR